MQNPTGIIVQCLMVVILYQDFKTFLFTRCNQCILDMIILAKLRSGYVEWSLEAEPKSKHRPSNPIQIFLPYFQVNFY